MANESEVKQKRDRSPDYPACSLREAINLSSKIYNEDRQNWTSSEVAVKHIGYNSLNGASRTALSALKKFGLIEYRGGDLRVTELAMRILLPKSHEEKAEAIGASLLLPKIYLWVREEFPGWELPSEANLKARLVRDLKFNPGAVNGFLKDLKDSIEFASEFALSTPIEIRIEPAEEEVAKPPSKTLSAQDPELPSGGRSMGIPGAKWFVWLPDDLQPEDAKRMKKWVEAVLVPQLLFIASDVE